MLSKKFQIFYLLLDMEMCIYKHIDYSFESSSVPRITKIKESI